MRRALPGIVLAVAACGGWRKGDALRQVNAGRWPSEEVAADGKSLAAQCDDDSGGISVHKRAEACWRIGALFERWGGKREVIELFQKRACAIDSRECR